MMGMAMQRRRLACLCFAAVLAVALCRPGTLPAEETGKGKKLLVVMSYHEETAMERQIKNGIEELLPDAAITYFWLDTKNRLAEGPARAEEAYEIYRRLQPDAVIAANDNAQSLFVVPYLLGKVATPVIFTGVNNDAGKYGYPAENVSGVVEKKHYRESIGFAQIIEPAIQRIGVIYKDNQSNRMNVAQILQEKSSYTVEEIDFTQVGTVRDVETAVHELSAKVDALLVLDLAGVLDQAGNPVEEAEVYGLVSRLAKKPTIGAGEWEIKAGILCGVVKMDQEQGVLAAEMLREVWGGKNAGDIPLTENRNGLRFLNIATVKKLGIRLQPQALIGTKIIISRDQIP